jgi:hypothetical protein
MVRRAANPAAVPPGTTIQWDFTDAEPWYVRLDNGSTAAVPGHAPDPSLTLRVGFEDWVDVVARRADPRRLLLTRRLRPKGDPRMLVRLPKLFG